MPGTLPSLPHPLIHHTVVPILQLKSYDTLEICVSYARTVPSFRTMDRDLGATPTQAVFWGWEESAYLRAAHRTQHPIARTRPKTEVWPNGLSVLESASLNYWTSVPATTEACVSCGACPLQEEKPQQWEGHTLQQRAAPALPQLEKALTQ